MRRTMTLRPRPSLPRGAGPADRGSAAAPPRGLLVAVCLGFFMVILDTTVVNVAGSAIRAGLGGGVTGLQWVVDGYALVFAAALLAAGAAADRFGARRVFLAGLAVFTVASTLCGLAATLEQLVAARLVQGAGAAMLVPASLALIQQAFSDPAARARAIGSWGAMGGAAAGLGPVVGGLGVHLLSWRAAFWINVPVGVLSAAVVRARSRPGPGTRHAVDVPGQVLVAVATAALVLALIGAGDRGGTSPAVLAGLGVAVVSVGALAVVERRSDHPVLPPGLVRTPAFAAASVAGLLLNLGFYGQLFVTSVYLEQVRHDGPLQAGLLLLPETCTAIVASPLGGRLAGARGPRLPSVAGFVLGAAGFAGLAAARPSTPYGWLVLPLVLAGFGTSLTMPAATTAVVEASGPRPGLGSATFSAARQVGGAVGVALLGSLVARSVAAGWRPALLVAAGSFLLGALVVAAGFRRTSRRPARPGVSAAARTGTAPAARRPG